MITIYTFLGKPGCCYEIKLNANCPDSEKSGEGPGSCGGSKEQDSSKFTSVLDIVKMQSDLLSIAAKENDPEKLSKIRSKYLELEEAKKSIPIKEKTSQSSIIKSKKDINNQTSKKVEPNVKTSNIFDKFSNDSLDLVDKMGERYKTALRIYVNGSVQLNQQLRTSKNNAFEESTKITDKDTIARLTKIIDNSKSPSNLTVYRGIDSKEWDNLPSKVGETYTSKSFTSTSHNDKVAKGFSKFYNESDDNSIIMEIRIKKGTPAFAMDSFVQREYPHSSWMVGENGKERTGGKQNEIVLNRNQKYKVIGIEKTGKNKKIILETL